VDPQDSGDLALHLAALLELFYCGVQCNRVAHAGSGTVAAPEDLLNFPDSRTRMTRYS